ncbi:proline-rich protein 23B-like [Rhynchocyon petersi]
MSLHRSRSPSPSSALQPEGVPPAKRGRWEEPMDPAAQPVDPTAQPMAQNLVTSVVVLAAGFALKLPLPDADLVLEPPPESLLRVSVGNHTLVLMQEMFLSSAFEDRRQSDAPISLELGSILTTLEEKTRQQEAFGPEANIEGPEFLQLCFIQFCPTDEPVPSPSPQDSNQASSPWVHALDSFHPEPGPNSPLQPLPPSPNPGLQEHSTQPSRSPCRALQRLF